MKIIVVYIESFILSHTVIHTQIFRIYIYKVSVVRIKIFRAVDIESFRVINITSFRIVHIVSFKVVFTESFGVTQIICFATTGRNECGYLMDLEDICGRET